MGPRWWAGIWFRVVLLWQQESRAHDHLSAVRLRISHWLRCHVMCWMENRLCVPVLDSAALLQLCRDQSYGEHLEEFPGPRKYGGIPSCCPQPRLAILTLRRPLAAGRTLSSPESTSLIAHGWLSHLPGGESGWTLENWDWFSLLLRISTGTASGQMASWSFQIQDAILQKQMMPFAVILQIICGPLGSLIGILFHKLLLHENSSLISVAGVGPIHSLFIGHFRDAWLMLYC